MCESSEGFSIGFLPGWFVHPVDRNARVAECMLFAEEPFAGTPDDTGRWPGAQVVVRLFNGCRGSFDLVASERELEVQGFTAWARELAVGEGPTAGEVYAYEWVIDLTPGIRCETGQLLVVRTEREAPGEHDKNKVIVDDMVSTLRFR